jgi:CRP/FNR family cyclic AMP-dependent transcriptional regulator
LRSNGCSWSKRYRQRRALLEPARSRLCAPAADKLRLDGFELCHGPKRNFPEYVLQALKFAPALPISLHKHGNPCEVSIAIIWLGIVADDQRRPGVEPDDQTDDGLPAVLKPVLEKRRAPYIGDDLLHALSAHATFKVFAKNTVVVSEGDRSTDSVHLIQSGRVKVYLCSADGKEVDLNVLESGDYFGEMSLDQGPRSASVMTVERTELAIIGQSEFRKFLAEKPDFAMQLILKLIARTRNLLKSVKSLALLDVSHRVARLLLEMATEENGKLIINEKLSKREIANRVGSTREMASRVFKDLLASGYIQMENKKITISKPLPQHW